MFLKNGFPSTVSLPKVQCTECHDPANKVPMSYDIYLFKPDNGESADEAFERLIHEHLNRVGLPSPGDRELRIDPPHKVGGDQGAVA